MYTRYRTKIIVMTNIVYVSQNYNFGINKILYTYFRTRTSINVITKYCIRVTELKLLL